MVTTVCPGPRFLAVCVRKVVPKKKSHKKLSSAILNWKTPGHTRPARHSCAVCHLSEFRPASLSAPAPPTNLKGRRGVERARCAEADAFLVQHSERHLDALLVRNEHGVVDRGTLQVVGDAALPNT